ncbi:MAG: glycosyltransferase family 2 protein [Chloroflexi bacterium]|nr:glycosyltransferase family 2 protein [Chloroflexota bacterium]
MTEHGQSSGEPTELATLAVVIVSYNVRELLAACLNATFASLAVSGLSSSVIVVDNVSSDGSAAMVAAEFPQVHLIASHDNLGFAGGNNLALRMLGFEGVEGQGRGGVGEQGRGGAGEHAIRNPQSAIRNPQSVLLLNPDAEPVGDAIGQMARFLAEHPQVGGVGAQLRYPDGRFQHGAFRFPGLLQLWFDLFPPRPRRLLDSRLNGRYARALFESGRPFPIDFTLGAALMVRRGAIAAAGLLDEGYFMYAEEVDWCWRIQRAGWPFYCVPSAVVIHHGGASTRQFRSQSFVNLWRSRLRLYGRFYGPVRRRLAATIVRLGLWAELRRARASAARGEITAEELAERVASVQQVRDLFAGTK